MTASHLLEFYGAECPHCNRMHPLVEQLEKGLGIKIEKYETWHNEENAALFQKYDQGCGGVPYFINTKTQQSICGEVDYETLKKWAQSE